MLRKTTFMIADPQNLLNASMRPQRNAAENFLHNPHATTLALASMRPQRNAAENGLGPGTRPGAMDRFNEAAA